MKTLLSAALVAAVFSQFVCTAAAKDEVRVRAVASRAGATPSELYVHGADGKASVGKVRVKTFLNHEFDRLETKGGVVVFTAKPEASSAKNEEDVIGQCELPAKGPQSLILFFTPEQPGKPRCKVTMVDASVKAFPPGSFKVVNGSALPVRVELQGEKFEFKPGETRVIAKPPMGDAGSANMKAYCERDGKWTAISAGIWPDPGEKRVLQIISDNPATKQVEIVGVMDVAKP